MSYYGNDILEFTMPEPIYVNGESGVRYEMEKIQDEIVAEQSIITVERNVRVWEDIPNIPQADLEEAIRIMNNYQLPPPVVPVPPLRNARAWDSDIELN